ncbi:MAG TPA: tRNA lysidine(34) synthetase TilS [Candidatus Acidoferrales bacterium]|nr:tRNA lysidine(34) synthetase TilS [Candidatus Acidoferrales bacterium]
MISKLHRLVLSTIRRHGMLSPGDRVGVAVSGGADSVGLLRLLEDVRKDLGLGLCVLHLNHELRGPASDADADFVARLARASGLECIAARQDVAALARAQHWNLEDAGRRARYRFFANAISQDHCNKVAVAHTADDQAETVLARILRGSGPRGIVGIHPVRGAIVRPLLETRRAEIREYLRAKGQEWREDATNLDASRLRARLRHDLLPRLEREFNPAIVERLASLAAISRDEEAVWHFLIDERLAALAHPIPGGFSIAASDLLAPHSLMASQALAAPLPLLPRNPHAQRALSRRMVRSLFAKIAADSSSLDFAHVEGILHFAATSQSGRRLQLPGGAIVARNFDNLEFIARAASAGAAASGSFPSRPHLYEYALALSGQSIAYVDVPELGARFCLKAIDWPLAESDTSSETGILDADRLQPPLVLRNWRPGDAFRLPGKRQAQKLKRLFSESRISVAERSTWPVLTSAGRIAWTRGWPAAAEFSPRKDTQRRVVVLEEKL